MPFGRTAGEASYPAFMDGHLRPCMDDCMVFNLDDILKYLEDPSQNKHQVCRVLETIRECGLYYKGAKCDFSVN
jgi:hypothetical protein